MKYMKYTVYYSKTTYGEIDVEAASPEEAQTSVENGDVDFGNARELDEPIECYDVVEAE